MEIIETGSQRMVTIPLESKLLQSNIIMITSEIDEHSVTEYQQQLAYLASTLKPGDTIHIWINSPGGSVYDGLGLYDLIQNLKVKGFIIHTLNIGMACSMASILLMSGTKGQRETFPHASVMVHEISSCHWGKTPELKDQYEETQRLQKIINDILKECASEELIDLCNRKDLWLDAENAIKYAIVDKIKVD